MDALSLPGGVTLLPGAPGAPVIYAHLEQSEAERVQPALEGRAALALLSCDWNRDLSPWPAPKAFKGGEDFSGGAEAHLKHIVETVIPAAEAALGYEPPWRGIAGYSLAGLFAVYALWKCDRFRRAASMSGSLWYDGFGAWLQETAPAAAPDYVYFSLGDREPRARNQRMAAVGTCTGDAVSLLRKMGVPVDFEWNTGGHFDDPEGRVLRGILRMIAYRPAAE